MKAELKAPAAGSAEARIMQLLDLKSMGPASAPVMFNVVFYRTFDNRRQVGSYFGLTAPKHARPVRIRAGARLACATWMPRSTPAPPGPSRPRAPCPGRRSSSRS